MELSLNILLDALSDANPLCYTKDKSRTFSGVRLLGKAQDADPGKLVICGLSQALNAPSEYQACVVAAVIDTELPKNAATCAPSSRHQFAWCRPIPLAPRIATRGWDGILSPRLISYPFSAFTSCTLKSHRRKPSTFVPR